jgi:uncharacterized protein YggE
MQRIFVCLVALLVVCAVAPDSMAEAGAGADSRAPVPTLTVSGTGHVAAPPDQALLRLGAVTQSKEAATAQEQINGIMQRTLEAIKALGIPEGKIATVGLSLWPVYTDQRPQKGEKSAEPKIAAYRASNSIRVQLDDLNAVGEVIDAGVSAGANQLQDISFAIRDDAEYRKQALFLAAQAARAKAEALASAMDVRIVSLMEVSEGGTNLVRPSVQLREMYAGKAATPVEPGEIQVEASVTVRYQVGEAESR